MSQVEELNTRVVIEQNEAWARGDFDRVLALYHPECTVFGADTPEKVAYGREGMTGNLQRGAEQFTVNAVKMLSVIAQGDLVSAEVEISCTYARPGDAREGRTFKLLVCSVIVMKDGMLLEERVYREPFPSQIERQIG